MPRPVACFITEGSCALLFGIFSPEKTPYKTRCKINLPFTRDLHKCDEQRPFSPFTQSSLLQAVVKPTHK